MTLSSNASILAFIHLIYQEENTSYASRRAWINKEMIPYTRRSKWKQKGLSFFYLRGHTCYIMDHCSKSSRINFMLVEINNLPPKQAISTYLSVYMVKLKASVDKVVGEVLVEVEEKVLACHE